MSDEDRLDRWARLKAESARPAPPAPKEEEAVDAAFVAALPTIERIDAATDLSGFLRKGVPDALRNAALARAWMADPAIRDRIPDAIDYAENYNAPHTISGWGQACPQEAQSYVGRTLDALRDQPEEDRAVAADEETAPEPAPPPASAPTAAVAGAAQDR